MVELNKDILGNTLEVGHLVAYASSTGIRIGCVETFDKRHGTTMRLIPKRKRPTQTFGKHGASVLALSLDRFLDVTNSNSIEPSEMNIKGRKDMTGLELKPGQLVAHVHYGDKGGYELLLGYIVEYGPRGGARVQRARKVKDQFISVTSAEPTYIGDCLVLNENLGKRLMKLRLSS